MSKIFIHRICIVVPTPIKYEISRALSERYQHKTYPTSSSIHAIGRHEFNTGYVVGNKDNALTLTSYSMDVKVISLSNLDKMHGVRFNLVFVSDALSLTKNESMELLYLLHESNLSRNVKRIDTDSLLTLINNKQFHQLLELN